MVDKLVNSEINKKRINNVEYCFGLSGVPLKVPGRVLVGEGVLTKICRKKPKSRQFFLFNDILVYGTILINKKKYASQHIIPLEGLVIEDLPDEVVMKNGWLIKTSSKSFAVYAGSPSEKAEWIRHIKKCANDLLEQTGRSVIKEHAAVWIPDSIARICMHCNTTQFTMLNRRHHCRACGLIVCGNCSRNRLVILHQSNRPVRVCDSCYNKSYNHLNKIKKTSTSSSYNVQQTSPLSAKSTEQQQQLVNDAAELKRVVKICVDDQIKKDSRVEDWVNLASEQVTEHLKLSCEKEADKKDKVAETTENAKPDCVTDEKSSKVQANDVAENAPPETKENEQKDEIKNEKETDTSSLNDQTQETSDSEDENNDLSSSVEDILDEAGKPTFYEDVHLVDKDAKDTDTNLKSSKEVHEQDLNVNVEKQLDDLKVNDESVKKDENMSSSDVKLENENVSKVQDLNESGQVELREKDVESKGVKVNRESRAEETEDEKTEF